MIRIAVDDLVFVTADAVVRPATVTLDPLSSSLRSLDHAAGPSFMTQLRLHRELAVGAAVVTASGDLAADFVIHAIIQSRDEPVSRDGVRHALVSALQQAQAWELGTIAVPPIGVGAGNLSIEEVAPIMVEVVSQVMETATFPREVCIVVDNEDDLATFEGLVKRIPQ